MNQIKQNTQYNPLLSNTMNIFYSLSFYSPIIICVSIVLFSMFTVTMNKAFVFFICVSLITFLRIIVFKAWSNDAPMKEIPIICSTGLSEIFIPKDVLYSTYLLTFTMMYFMVPMFMISVQNNVNIINYGVLAFFICYIGIDIFIKNKLLCIPGNFSKNVFGNILSGMFLGGVIAGLIMYGTQLKVYLYINEINSNKEVCSMPSKQQFKCKVYKDGTLVGNM
jgi:hypothetical protein